MKKIFNSVLILTFLFLGANSVKAVCPANISFGHTQAGISNVIDDQHPSVINKYWCLSGVNFANNGTNISWFQQYSPGYWYIYGTWQDFGVVGCCYCWDPSTFHSRTMIFKLEQNRNPNTILHRGEYTVELCESNLQGNCFIPRPFYRPFSGIPTFHIKNWTSSGPGGITTIEIDNWGSIPGPAHYWISRLDGSEGEDLPLNPKCQPDCGGSCPEPIVGYKIKAIAAASPPSSGQSIDWNLNVNGGIITPRIPTFPFTVQIQNPSTCDSSNQYIYIATQLLFEGGIESYYVSENSIGISWCLQNPSEAGKSMLCNKTAGTAITCTYTNGGSCAIDNTIYYGPLNSVSSYAYSGAACNVGSSGSATFDPGEGNWFWIIVSNNGTYEGSYGKDSNGMERPEASGIGNCDYPQNLNNTCGQVIKEKM